jgi:hypothetical protein
MIRALETPLEALQNATLIPFVFRQELEYLLRHAGLVEASIEETGMYDLD